MKKDPDNPNIEQLSKEEQNQVPKNTAAQMNREIFNLSYYRGTLLSKYSIVFMLIAFLTYTSYKLAAAKSVIFILALIFALPFFIEALLSMVPEKKETVYFLTLRNKFDYSYKNKQIQTYAMLVLYAILMVWQRSYTPKYQVRRLYYYPTYILIAGIVVRILLTAFYFIHIKRQLETGRLH